MSALDVHPSGKLALSVGIDCTMRTWNLVTGRHAYITNIKNGLLFIYTNSIIIELFLMIYLNNM